MNPTTENKGPAFTQIMDLASERLGGKALATSDDFFAPKEDLVKAAAAVFISDKYTENGKWMDGWESRRKRGIDKNSHDWCIVRLGAAGIIHGVNVDTSHFTGNFPEGCSIEVCRLADDKELSSPTWKEILPRTLLKGGSFNYFEISNRDRWTHLRLNIFPDGGVARLRVYGEVKPLWDIITAELKKKNELIDLACAQFGAVVVSCNDSYFGHKDNLIMPGRSKNMGDGWETRRKRGIDENSNDWIIIKLGHPGLVKNIEIDTNFFKGNYPDAGLIEATKDFNGDRTDWHELLPKTKLKAHAQTIYNSELKNKDRVVEYIRLKIFPDGGISRLRINGVPV